MGSFPATALSGVVGVDGFLAQHGSQLFEGSRLFTAQENGGIHVTDDGICVILIDRLELTLCLQHQTGRDFTASDGGHQLFQFRNLPDVSTLINQTAHMNGNNYQTGAEQIKLTTQRKPEEDVYLIGYRGGEYTGNNWNKADDVQICNELDKKKGNTYARYSSIYSTSEVFGNLYYLGNYIMKSNGLAVSKDKDRRLQLDIAYTSDKNNIMLEPYCSNLYLAQKNSYDEYSVMYYEQKDMVSLWDSDNITDLTKKSRMDDYINVQFYN